MIICRERSDTGFMRIIGVTGPTGSGKTLLTQYFSQLGIPTIDADKLYHSMLVPPSPCLDAIKEAFGECVFAPDGSLNRVELSKIVFSDSKKLELLNQTVLRIVIARIREIIAVLESKGETCVVVDAPTLIEAKFDKECDTVIAVLCPANDRVIRIAERDGISTERAKERVMAQKPDDFYVSAAEHVIVNDKGEVEFNKQIKELATSLRF
jgi:dephospho-CoA kinase